MGNIKNRTGIQARRGVQFINSGYPTPMEVRLSGPGVWEGCDVTSVWEGWSAMI